MLHILLHILLHIMFASMLAIMSNSSDERDQDEASVMFLEKMIKFLAGALRDDSMQKQEMFLGRLDFPFICKIFKEAAPAKILGMNYSKHLNHDCPSKRA